MNLSLVVVTYRSSSVLTSAIESFRREAADLGGSSEVIIVEQSEDDREASLAESCKPDHLVVRPNYGYASGLNAGVQAARGDLLLLGNPDVRFMRGSLEPLLAALASGWDVAGPQFSLADCLFPPADVQTPTEELRRWWASQAPNAWHRFYRREVRRWCRVWQSETPVSVPTLSGALLACRAEVISRVGPWDEGYFLYFEETDWLRRARRLGFQLCLVPKARMVHVWGHAAEPKLYEPQFSRSRRRYLARNFGLAGRLVAGCQPRSSPVQAQAWSKAPVEHPAGRWWLLSPTSLGFPAAWMGEPTSPEPKARQFLAEWGRAEPLILLSYDPESEEVRGAWSIKT